MLADYLQLPFPKYRRCPVSFEAVVHTHLRYSPRLCRAAFVKRDGRDLVVSSYFKLLNELVNLHADNLQFRKYKRRYPSLMGATGDVDDTRKRMPSFIGEWWRRPPGCRLNWEDYSMSWLNNNGNVVVTSYEKLRSDCETELRRMVQRLSSQSIDRERLAATVLKHSFETQTGRRPGEEDAQSNKRKGIVGDWRNYFTPAAVKEFHRLAGRTLISLGYETNDSWVRANLT
jgi:hypothetical protein